jgi:ureidoglycolate lyase
VFLVPKGTLVKIRQGVWHHAPFAFNCDFVNVLVVLPERSYANNCIVSIIPEAEQMEIELEQLL